MSFRDKFRKFKADAKLRIFQVNEGKVSNDPTSQPPATIVSDTPHNWTYLRLFSKSLEQATRPFSPLKAAVVELRECFDIFEGVLHGRKEYEILYKELEAVFQVLQTHCTQNTPPAITATVECLCKSMQDEVSRLRQIQGKGKVREYLEADQDAEEVLACYQRIQGYLQRISLNADMSIWRAVDEIATDNRLKNLSPSLSARFNSAQAVGLKRGPCIRNTRVDLLTQILGWIDSSSPGSVYWMNGMAGTGKTTIAYSLCLELESKQQLAASFFCSRVLPECRDVNLIIPSIAYQIARFSCPFRFALSTALEKDPDVHTQLPHIQFNTLIAQPLFQVKHTLPDNLVVVIDALDECESQESTGRILEMLLTGSPNMPIKFVISSRPEPEIRDEMVKQDNQASSRMVLHELDRQIVKSDIETYLRVAMVEVELTEEQIATLVERSGILFIYAATVVRYIGHDRFRRNPRARLANILESSSASENKHKEIDELYAMILRSALDDPTLDRTEREDMRQVLHTVICAQEPLAVDTLSGLLQMNDTDRVQAALRPLWSVLHISGASKLVTTLHASFPDYMLESSRSKQFYCDAALHNQTMALLCFDYFGAIRVQFNICGLESSYMPDDQVEGLEARVQGAISAELFYAARYWGTHLRSAAGLPYLIRRLDEFLSRRLLVWMEVMSLKKCAHFMPQIIWLVEKWSKECSAELSALIHDAWRFASTFALSAVSDSTPHIYTSMLPLWPELSPVAQCYTRCMERMVKAEGTAVGRRQNALLATWSFDDHIITSTFSPDGTQVAVGVRSKVYLVSSLTGREILPPLEGHSETISSAVFSPDGTRIASSSYDNTICIWSTQSSKILIGPLKLKETTSTGYSNPVSIAFSPDNTRLVSSSSTSVCIWDADSGMLILELDQPASSNYWVQSAKYTPDGHHIVVLNEGGIQIRDGRNGQLLRHLASKLYDPFNACISIDISPDGARIASGSNVNSIYILEFLTGQVMLGPLNITVPKMCTSSHTFVNSVSFSPDGLYLVCGSSAGICMWDTRNGSLVFGPVGGNSVTASFSPDAAYLISCSGKTLRLWDTRSTHKPLHQLQSDDNLMITQVGLSPDGTRVVSKSNDSFSEILYLWDVGSGEMVLELPRQGRSYDQVPAVLSPEGSYLLEITDRGLVFVDTRTGNITRSLFQNSRNALRIPSARFSPDGSYIVFGELEEQDFRSRLGSYHLQASEHTLSHTSLPQENIVKILEVETGQTSMVIHLPRSSSHGFQSVPFATFASDGAHIITRSTYNHQRIICVYDAQTGRLLHDRLRGNFLSFALSPDGTRLVSHSESNLMIYDTRSGEQVLGPLGLHTDWVNSVGFSPDGRHIASGANDHTVCIWDAQSGQPVLGPVKWHTGPVRSVGFSPDDTRLVSSSTDNIIRVTDVRIAEVPDPTLQSTGEWELREDGWVADKFSRLLIWVPPDLRASLMWPRTKLVISPEGYLRLNFEGAHIGESWAKSYRPI